MAKNERKYEENIKLEYKYDDDDVKSIADSQYSLK